MNGENLIKKMDNLILEGRIGNKFVTEIISLMINVENFILPKLCGVAFYPAFRKMPNEENINNYHVQHKPNTLIAIKAAVSKLPEEET